MRRRRRRTGMMLVMGGDDAAAYMLNCIESSRGESCCGSSGSDFDKLSWLY
jgi:hypothetical protein